MLTGDVPMPSVGALQEILEDLNITSLDESDLEAGFQDLNCSELDFGSAGQLIFEEEIFLDDGVADDGSSLSGISAEVNAALANGTGGEFDDAGMAMAALESQLRLSAASATPSASLWRSLGFQASLASRQSQDDTEHQRLAALVQAQARELDDLKLASSRPLAGPLSPETSPFLPATAAIAAAPAGAGFRLQMQDLTISEAAYQALRTKKDEDLTVREWVQLRFHELRSVQRAEVQRLQLEVEALREDLVTAQTRADKAERQQARKTATVTDLTQELEKQRREARAQLEQLKADLEISQQTVLELRDKGRRFDEVAKERAQFQEEARSIRQAMASQTATQLQLTKEHAETVDRVQQLDGECRLLRQDNDSHNRRCKMLEQTLELRDDEVRELKAKVESLREKKRELARKAALDQVSSTQEVRDHVETEIRRFQDQARADLEAVRVNLNALHEKEVSMLRDRHENAELRICELQRRLEDEEQKHQALQLSSTRIRAELQNEITELTGMLKLRAFEVERAALTHEEVSCARQRLEVENEQLRNQVEVLRKEYYTLEVQHREGRAGERAELASLREQLRGYVELEKELDSAIRSCAEGPRLGTPGDMLSTMKASARGDIPPSDVDVGEALLIGTTLASVPASAQRRIQQSLILAQELQRRTREAMQAKAALQDAEHEIVKLQSELEAARHQADSALRSEPQAYLLSSLREREAESLRLRRELRTTTAELERSRQQLERAQSSRLRTENDLRKLLAQRQHLAGLQALLQVSNTSEAEISSGGGLLNAATAARADRRGRAPTQSQASTIAGSGAPAWLHRLQSKLKQNADKALGDEI